jgi:heme-degrading monooxygenase HmoA
LFVTLWEFEVKSGSEELFEQAYGSGGEWVRLFRRDVRYRGTRLLRDVGRERVYITMDLWASREASEEFRQKFTGEYEEIGNPDTIVALFADLFPGKRIPTRSPSSCSPD